MIGVEPADGEPVEQGTEGVGLEIDLHPLTQGSCRVEACEDPSDDLGNPVPELCDLRGHVRIGAGGKGELEPHRGLRATVGIQRQQILQSALHQRAAGELSRTHSSEILEVATEPLLEAAREGLDRELPDLLLTAAVVAHGADRESGLLGDAAQRGAREAIARDNTEHRRDDVTAALLGVHDLGHTFL